MRKKDKKTRGTLVTMERKDKQISEQFISLRSNIKFASFNKDIKTIVVTSPSPGDGKTMTAANLAMVFSQEGKKVLLVDADLRKPSIHYMYGLPNEYGLCNFLIGQKNINSIIRNVYTNIDVITSGITPPNPPELLGSVQMNEFITLVKEQYDMVIFDTPPVLAVTDATLIANQSDGCLLVVRVKKNDVKEVTKVKEQLKFAGANLLGAVLNGKKQATNHYYYEK